MGGRQGVTGGQLGVVVEETVGWEIFLGDNGIRGPCGGRFLGDEGGDNVGSKEGKEGTGDPKGAMERARGSLGVA